MHHAMLDLETWGLRRGNALRSIGLVPFDPYTGLVDNSGQSFYQNVNFNSQAAVGLTKDDDTVKWWDGPELAEARSMLENDQQSLNAAIQYLDRFLRNHYGEDPNSTTEEACQTVRLWSRGTMDWEVLEGAYEALGRKFPFHLRAQRDSRVILDLVEYDHTFFCPQFIGVPHYALDDARHEAHCVNAVYAHRYLGVAADALCIMTETPLDAGEIVAVQGLQHAPVEYPRANQQTVRAVDEDEDPEGLLLG